MGLLFFLCIDFHLDLVTLGKSAFLNLLLPSGIFENCFYMILRRIYNTTDFMHGHCDQLELWPYVRGSPVFSGTKHCLCITLTVLATFVKSGYLKVFPLGFWSA